MNLRVSAALAHAPWPYLILCRPHQWLKNLLVFLPLAAAHRFSVVVIAEAMAMFLAFCAIASATYILNDWRDLEADRAHPRKRLRPLAAGTVLPRRAMLLGLILAFAASAIALSLSLPAFGALTVYALTTVLYSLELKRRLVIDVLTLAMLYALRVLAGAVAVQVPVSPWLVLLCLFLFLCLALIKRYVELIAIKSLDRQMPANRAYHVDDLPILVAMACASGFTAVLVMGLYIASEMEKPQYNHPEILWFICPLMMGWLARALMVAHRGRMHDDPLVYSLTDRPSQLACGLTVITFFLAL